MADSESTDASSTGDFYPVDYTDGRKPLEWQTKYPDAAWKKIKAEIVYLIIISVLYILGLFFLLFNLQMQILPNGPEFKTSLFFTLLSSWCAGSIGGSLFTIKWLYHCVAKLTWHEDRFIWRLLTPHTSGAVALFSLILITSGLLLVFDQTLIQKPYAILGASFLIGYFSDKALAKFAETADFLFGVSK